MFRIRDLCQRQFYKLLTVPSVPTCRPVDKGRTFLYPILMSYVKQTSNTNDHILRKGAFMSYSTCMDNTEVLNITNNGYVKAAYSLCSATKFCYSKYKCDAHLCQLSLQKCCMLALLLDSLSGCPLSSHHQHGGCL